MKCPKCNNTQGFVFGMCIECGWNHISDEYDKIQVWAGDAKYLPPEIWELLVDIHDELSDKNRGE